jgi:hypothetical protein
LSSRADNAVCGRRFALVKAIRGRTSGFLG